MNRNVSFLSKGMCALLLSGVLSCSPGKEENKEMRKTSVRVQKIEYKENFYQQEYVGTGEGENAVDLSFEVNGNMEQVYVQEGQQVGKGQLLARLNTKTMETMHAAAKATLNQAQDAYNRLSLLRENNSLPEIKYIEARTALEQAKSSEEVMRKNLDDCNLYAPFAGVIGRRYQEAGANVMPGTPIYNLVTIQSVKIRIAIPENEISGIRLGETCQVKIAALEDAVFEGKIVEKGVSAHPISHTYDVKAQINNKEARIMPGMVCKAYLVKNTIKEGKGDIVVPLQSVQIDYSGKHFVWLKDNENKAVYKEVVLGSLLGNGVVIEEGLREGDLLIVEGYQNISPGSIVEVATNK